MKRVLLAALGTVALSGATAGQELHAELDLRSVEGVLAATLLAPFHLPRVFVGDRGGAARFDAYPYASERGFWLPLDEGDEGRAEWSLRPRWEIGTDFDDLERTGLGLELEHANRFGIEGAWSRWVEDRESGGSDELDLGDANLVWRFAQAPTAAFRAGLGLLVLDDSDGTDLGVQASYAARFLPARPFTAAAELDLGTFGGDAELIHLRAEVGVLVTRFELLAAWDHFDVDGEELRSVALGLRAWL